MDRRHDWRPHLLHGGAECLTVTFYAGAEGEAAGQALRLALRRTRLALSQRRWPRRSRCATTTPLRTQTGLAQYDGNAALMVRLLHTGTIGATYYVRAAGAWAALGPVFQGDKGAGGNAGNDGAPGGGSWEIRGNHAETGTHAASVFVATGIMLGDISDDAIFMYGLGDSAVGSVLLLINGATLFGQNAAAAGDTCGR